MIGLIGWIIGGGIVGWLASMITGRNAQQGLIGNILAGIIGVLLLVLLLVGLVNWAVSGAPAG